MNELELLKTAIEAAIKGGIDILDVYRQKFDVEFKEDKSPLTIADKRAHDSISKILENKGLPILSEEGRHLPFETRRNWDRFWLVDPLDGTKEFVKRNGEFTVNIALIINHKPEIGVIFVPVSGQLYFASDTTGARKIKVPDLINPDVDELVRKAVMLPIGGALSKTTVVCSRSHMSAETEEYIKELAKSGKEIDFVSIGSSLKLCLVAEGNATIYPRFGPTMEWDTAAGHAIVEKSGGKVTLIDHAEPLKYNKPQLLNPWFIAFRPE